MIGTYPEKFNTQNSCRAFGFSFSTLMAMLIETIFDDEPLEI
jgi:hypothetical protein